MSMRTFTNIITKKISTKTYYRLLSIVRLFELVSILSFVVLILCEVPKFQEAIVQIIPKWVLITIVVAGFVIGFFGERMHYFLAAGTYDPFKED